MVAWKWIYCTMTIVANGDAQPNDLVTGTADSRITALAAEFRDISGGTDYAAITIVSSREMHLIIAEGKMAGGDAAGCLAELNKIRALDELAAYTAEDAGAALQAERRANLFVQGRRLSDMYRFGVTSDVWDAMLRNLRLAHISQLLFGKSAPIQTFRNKRAYTAFYLGNSTKHVEKGPF